MELLGLPCVAFSLVGLAFGSKTEGLVLSVKKSTVPLPTIAHFNFEGAARATRCCISSGVSGVAPFGCMQSLKSGGPRVFFEN